MKDPAVLFYTSDFIAGTLTMTDAQRGKYILLLCLQHQQGFLTEHDILKVCRKFDDKIYGKFEKDTLGYFYNKRMLLESEKRNKHCEKQRENANKRWNKDECHGIAKGMPLENENINEDINIDLEKKEELLKKREEEFKNCVFEFAKKYPVEMLFIFCDYWTEKNKSKTKMRFELEKTFEISKRLATWASRDKEFNKILPAEKLFTHQEMLELENKTPGTWKDYETIKANGKVMYKQKQ